MRQHRTYVDLPADLVDHLHSHADFRGVSVSALCFHWISTAGQMAYRGQGHLLPQVPLQGSQRRGERGTLGVRRPVRWLQSSAEFNRCRDLINDAGSTVPAVLRAAGEAYIAAGGDVLAMAWPPKSALAEAA